MFQNLDNRERALLLAMVMAVLAVVFYYFPLRSQMETYASAREQLEVKQDRLRQAETALRSSKTETEKAKQVQEQLAEYIKFFDTDFRHGSALMLLSFKALDLNISITNLEPGGILDRGDYLELPVKLSLTGGYHSMRLLLGELEALPNLAEIRSLKITTGSQTSGGEPVAGIQAATTAGGTPVEARCELVVYSGPAPGSTLSLEQQKISAWQTGRDNPFTTPGLVSPHPEVPGPLLNPEFELVEPEGNPAAPGQHPAPLADSERDKAGDNPGTGVMNKTNPIYRLILKLL